MIRHWLWGGRLFETEIELEVIEPGDSRIDLLLLQEFGEVLKMIFPELSLGSVVIGHHDGIALHAQVPFQAAEEVPCQVRGMFRLRVPARFQPRS